MSYIIPSVVPLSWIISYYYYEKNPDKYDELIYRYKTCTIFRLFKDALILSTIHASKISLSVDIFFWFTMHYKSNQYIKLTYIFWMGSLCGLSVEDIIYNELQASTIYGMDALYVYCCLTHPYINYLLISQFLRIGLGSILAYLNNHLEDYNFPPKIINVFNIYIRKKYPIGIIAGTCVGLMFYLLK